MQIKNFYVLGYMCNLFVLKTCKQLQIKAKYTGSKHALLDSVICCCGSQDCTEFLKGTGCLCGYKNIEIYGVIVEKKLEGAYLTNL